VAKRLTPQYKGHGKSAKAMINKSQKMQAYEAEAKRLGIPISRVIAQSIADQELIRLKEHTQKEEEELEISRGVDIGQSIAN